MAPTGQNKRKKFHDKDKYYRLAKEQGLRSRAAFKLVQINRKFPILETATGILDLCAAPGGWSQICSRTVGRDVPIVAVDVLPIRHLPNVTTLIGDITTPKCQADIRRAVQQQDGTVLNVVLHDGAPNVGAEYAKDAYEQNELALRALDCATQHLGPGGTFCTKLYRSRDYAKYVWVLHQLFDHVDVIKPPSSRQQSAEIFVLARSYKAPRKLDPKLLDPKYVFESVQGDTTGGGNNTATTLSVFDKRRTKQHRHRSGYDMEHLDAGMQHVEPIAKFVTAPTLAEAIAMLSSSTRLGWQCQQCEQSSCACEFLRQHALTTPEIRESLSDLQVLNKSDFKALLTWRSKIQNALAARKQSASDDGDDDNEHSKVNDENAESLDSDAEEEQIQAEITEMRERRLRERKRGKKKERAQVAKRRTRAALGMDLNAVDVPENDQLFSLTQIASRGDLAAVSEVNLDQITDDQLRGGSESEKDSDNGSQSGSEGDSDDEHRAVRMRQREEDLDEAYAQYLEHTKDGLAKAGTKMQKRSKKLMREKAADEAMEDQEMEQLNEVNLGNEVATYAKLLGGNGNGRDDVSESDSDDSSNDGFNDNPMSPEEHATGRKRRKIAAAVVERNPLLHTFGEETSAKTARWFSNPLFEKIGKMASRSAEVRRPAERDTAEAGTDTDSEDNQIISPDEVVAMMPKTDKQKRHEKRLKQMQRDERQQTKRAKKLGAATADFEVAVAVENDGSGSDGERAGGGRNGEVEEVMTRKLQEARELIKAGMGPVAAPSDDYEKFELAPQEPVLPIMDDRKYDSTHEDYDSDDYARTLALGTMILRRSKEKALVDASYNRYAWNDPKDLPEWFVDDENKHYRPQLPIPPALLAKMKEKMMSLSTKPIAKVAEARARKSKRAKAKLAAAKKQAEAVANSSDMTESMKLKAISKALRGHEAKRPSKTYVVAKKGRSAKGGKGVKLVDKRLRSDKRSMERSGNKRKKGKQGGLVGSKKRRHHK